MQYPGGKNGAGTYQRIINQIPPHDLYVELFSGSGAILRHKRPARLSHAVDLDAGILARLSEAVPRNTTLDQMDAIDFLLGFRFSASLAASSKAVCFIYTDPPYLNTKSPVKYRHKMTPEQHAELLDVLLRMPCPVMISGYRSDLYEEKLADWRTDCFKVVTRGGTKATEWLWMNYPEPTELHDYQYIGRTWRERERLARQRRRWVAGFQRLAPLQQKAILADLSAEPATSDEVARLPHHI